MCSLCNEGYYLDYQLNCQSCPIAGSKICTINSLISCQNNFWLDNNAANCIQCDFNCQQCSSTTRCSTCQQGFYLKVDFTCGACLGECLECSSNSSCLSCSISSLFFNTNTGNCSSGPVLNCVSYDSARTCLQCDNSSYLDSAKQCITLSNSSVFSQCSAYIQLANSSVICGNCSLGWFNSTPGCSYGCSVLCTSCYGPHFGLCWSCRNNAYLSNLQCLPLFNTKGGAAFQLHYTASNNPTVFSLGAIRAEDSCIW